MKTLYSFTCSLVICLVFLTPNLRAEDEKKDSAVNDVIQQMKKSRSEEWNSLTTAMRLPSGIVVVKSKHGLDTVENVLDMFEFSYKLIDLSEIEKTDFTETKALLINCIGGNYTNDRLSGKITKFADSPSQKALEKIHDFVAGGGYLFTTDWGVGQIIEPTFPNTIQRTGKRTPEDPNFKKLIPATPPKKHRKHEFLKGIFDAGKNNKGDGTQAVKLKSEPPRWVLGHGSMFFKPHKRTKIRIIPLLVSDKEIKKQYGSNLIGVTFEYKGRRKGPRLVKTSGRKNKSKKRRGCVMHVLSHFNQQQVGNQDQKGRSSMYQLLINFLIKATSQ